MYHLLRTVPLLVAGVMLIGAAGLNTALAQPNPVLDVEPNPLTGTQATAYGQNFCTDPACSSVTITLGSRTVASDVSVGSGGRFQAAFDVTEPAGLYVVSATQTAADGHAIRAEASLSVPTTDHNVSPPVTTASPTPAPTAPPTTTGASPTPAPSGESSPTPPSTGAGTPIGTPSGSPTGGSNQSNGDGGLSVFWALAGLLIVALAGAGTWFWLRRSRNLP
jgi:hypothetical protein